MASKTDDKTEASSSKPQGGGITQAKLVTAGIFGLLTYVGKNALVIDPAAFTTYAGGPLKDSFTGIKPIDAIMKGIVPAFSWPVAAEDEAPRIQIIYLLSVLAAAVVVWTVEGHRINHRTSTYLAAGQLFGIGVVGPVYYGLSIMADRGDKRYVAPEVGKAMVPSLCIGYILPTIMMFMPFDVPILRQNLTAFWQGSPIYTAFLVSILAAFLTRMAGGKKAPDASSRKQALGSLQSAYSFSFAGLALSHASVLFYVWKHPGLSIFSVFFDVPNPLASRDLSDPAESMFTFLKFDLILFSLSTFIYLMYTLANLQTNGHIKNEDAMQMAVTVLVGQVLVGPGATYVAFWHWREGVLARLEG